MFSVEKYSVTDFSDRREENMPERTSLSDCCLLLKTFFGRDYFPLTATRLSKQAKQCGVDIYRRAHQLKVAHCPQCGAELNLQGLNRRRNNYVACSEHTCTNRVDTCGMVGTQVTRRAQGQVTVCSVLSSQDSCL
ncbi:hypothetical protein J6590_071728 [Homalodisca vitripennis]|nr:hypothetical protein J6590_071728 [Homalodisca vitripennis]